MRSSVVRDVIGGFPCRYLRRVAGLDRRPEAAVTGVERRHVGVGLVAAARLIRDDGPVRSGQREPPAATRR